MAAPQSPIEGVGGWGRILVREAPSGPGGGTKACKRGAKVGCDIAGGRHRTFRGVSRPSQGAQNFNQGGEWQVSFCPPSGSAYEYKR